jgi:hypothetical protein
VRKKKSAEIADERAMAMFVAMVVRNALEDFHSRHLTNAQMKELNLIIRNAVFTALHAAARAKQSQGARAFVQFHSSCVPDYWEMPGLLEDYTQSLRRFDEAE